MWIRTAIDMLSKNKWKRECGRINVSKQIVWGNYLRLMILLTRFKVVKTMRMFKFVGQNS